MEYLPPGYGVTCQFFLTGVQWPHMTAMTPMYATTHTSCVHLTIFCCFRPSLVVVLVHVHIEVVCGGGSVRHAVVKAQHGSLETPNEGHVEVPAGEKTF